MAQAQFQRGRETSRRVDGNQAPGLSEGRAARRIGRSMITRSTRRAVAWIGILGIALAQLALTAHAARSGPRRRSMPAARRSLRRATLRCLAATTRDSPPGRISANCIAATPRPATPSADLLLVALTALPVTVVEFAAAAAAPSDAHSRPAAFPGASPPLLQFCRLLI